MKNQSLAVTLMESLFTSNTYQSYKMDENELKAISKEVKNRHPQDMKRWEFKRVIAIQQFPNVYETDFQGLNTLLSDVGLLTKVAYFDLNKQSPLLEKLHPFKNPIESFIKFSPKRGLVKKMDYLFSRYGDEALIDLWLTIKNEHELLEREIEAVKEKIMECTSFQKTRKEVTNFGSVLLMDKRPTYNMEVVFEELGPDFIIKHAKVNSTELDKYVIKGIISQKEIEQFRKVVNISERYVILTKDSAQVQYEMLSGRRQRQAENLKELWTHKM